MKKPERRSVPSIKESAEINNDQQEKRIRFWSGWGTGQRVIAIVVCLFLVAGAFGAGMKYLEDSAREQKLNGKNAASGQNASLLSSINPFVEPPLPTSTPQLSKEYIYAGSRMLAVEDANASAAPPADLAVWRPSTGYWYVLGGQGSQPTQLQWGQADDVTVPGDYDGDGKTDFSVFRPSAGSWYIVRSSDGTNFSYSFGQEGDKPAPADYDGDGKTDAAIVRPNYPVSGSATWFIQFSSTSTFIGYTYGSQQILPHRGILTAMARRTLPCGARQRQRHFIT